MQWHLEPTESAEGMPEGIGDGARADMRMALDAIHELMQDAEQDAAAVVRDFALWETELGVSQ